MPSVRAFLKFFSFALNCLWVVPVQSLILLFTKGSFSYHLPRIWHNAVRSIFGIRYEIIGTPCTDKQTIFMSNHLSYLDIPVLGSIIKSPFVAKSEVEGWAVFGFLSTLQQTIFIQRKRSEAAKQKNELQSRIDAGNSLIIFPEGTSTSGLEVFPFKSSLFSLALGEGRENLYVQPVTIKLVEIDGKAPHSKEEHDIYAWPFDDDIELGEHLTRFAKTSGAKLRITFHPPLKASDYNDRKVLAKACHDNVSKGLELPKAA